LWPTSSEPQANPNSPTEKGPSASRMGLFS